MHQLAFIPNAYREVLDQIDGITSLPFIVALIRAPFDETGPAGQSGEVKAKVTLPGIGKNTEGREAFEQRVLR